MRAPLDFFHSPIKLDVVELLLVSLVPGVKERVEETGLL